MTTDKPTYPVRAPAPGPCVILDLPHLWRAIETEMDRRGLTEMKQVAEVTGVDRGTLGRIRKRALAGEIVEGQRGGVNINAYLTLVAFASNGRTTRFGKELRGGVAAYWPGPEPTDDESHAAALAE